MIGNDRAPAVIMAIGAYRRRGPRGDKNKAVRAETRRVGGSDESDSARKKKRGSMINTTIKITHESATQRASNEAWLHLHGVQECAQRESKVYRGTIADVQQRAARARLRRSTVIMSGCLGGDGFVRLRRAGIGAPHLTPTASEDSNAEMRLLHVHGARGARARI